RPGVSMRAGTVAPQRQPFRPSSRELILAFRAGETVEVRSHGLCRGRDWGMLPEARAGCLEGGRQTVLGEMSALGESRIAGLVAWLGFNLDLDVESLAGEGAAAAVISADRTGH